MARKYRLEYRQRKMRKEKEKEQKKQEPVNPVKEFLGWILYIGVIVGMTFLIVTYVGQRTRVSGESMESSLHNGDNLIVDKISYRIREPKRYEIVVFPYRHQENTFYIKRIIGLPGETVQIKEGEVYINGKLLGETYGLEKINVGEEGIAKDKIVLGPDEYFVLGDNRNHSSDSRDSSVGLLKKDELIGRAFIRIWPLDNFGVISHE